MSTYREETIQQASGLSRGGGHDEGHGDGQDDGGELRGDHGNVVRMCDKLLLVSDTIAHMTLTSMLWSLLFIPGILCNVYCHHNVIMMTISHMPLWPILTHRHPWSMCPDQVSIKIITCNFHKCQKRSYTWVIMPSDLKSIQVQLLIFWWCIYGDPQVF